MCLKIMNLKIMTSKVTVSHTKVVHCSSALHECGHIGDSQSHNLCSYSELEEVMLFLPQQSKTKTRGTEGN